jgi:hypothetical protein
MLKRCRASKNSWTLPPGNLPLRAVPRHCLGVPANVAPNQREPAGSSSRGTLERRNDWRVPRKGRSVNDAQAKRACRRARRAVHPARSLRIGKAFPSLLTTAGFWVLDWHFNLPLRTALAKTERARVLICYNADIC